jgi:hypothetical protein
VGRKRPHPNPLPEGEGVLAFSPGEKVARSAG